MTTIVNEIINTEKPKMEEEETLTLPNESKDEIVEFEIKDLDESHSSGDENSIICMICRDKLDENEQILIKKSLCACKTNQVHLNCLMQNFYSTRLNPSAFKCTVCKKDYSAVADMIALENEENNVGNSGDDNVSSTSLPPVRLGTPIIISREEEEEEENNENQASHIVLNNLETPLRANLNLNLNHLNRPRIHPIQRRRHSEGARRIIPTIFGYVESRGEDGEDLETQNLFAPQNMGMIAGLFWCIANYNCDYVTNLMKRLCLWEKLGIYRYNREVRDPIVNNVESCLKISFPTFLFDYIFRNNLISKSISFLLHHYDLLSETGTLLNNSMPNGANNDLKKPAFISIVFFSQLLRTFSHGSFQFYFLFFLCLLQTQNIQSISAWNFIFGLPFFMIHFDWTNVALITFLTFLFFNLDLILLSFISNLKNLVQLILLIIFVSHEKEIKAIANSSVSRYRIF